jgi:hypothetical protein
VLEEATEGDELGLERERKKGRETAGSNRIEGAVGRPQSILLLSLTMTSLCQTD